MNILISGASGFIGSELVRLLTEQGQRVLPLNRSVENVEQLPFWDIEQEIIQLNTKEKQEQIDIVIHLAGENIAQDCWTAKKKERIRQSRVKGTRLLAEFFAATAYRPRLMICASAIGFYGDRGQEKLVEHSAKGTGFLADVSHAWEEAAQPARKAGIRVVHTRFGMVFSANGGALAKMLPAFKMGLGGSLGNGSQYISWISLQDAVQAINHIIQQEDLDGPINLVAPHPVTNWQFTKALGKALQRPTFFPIPKFFPSLFLGEMAKEVLFASTRVYPERLEKSGYVFTHPDLDIALPELLR